MSPYPVIHETLYKIYAISSRELQEKNFSYLLRDDSGGILGVNVDRLYILHSHYETVSASELFGLSKSYFLSNTDFKFKNSLVPDRMLSKTDEIEGEYASDVELGSTSTFMAKTQETSFSPGIQKQFL